MKQLISVILVLLTITTEVHATAQAPDRIIVDGYGYAMHNNPMQKYFRKYPNKKPKAETINSGLRRGYIATFEFVDDYLTLHEIKILRPYNRNRDSLSRMKSVTHLLAPNNEKLRIDWFTGILILPHGELVKYVHAGYASTFSHYVLLEVKNGKLTDRRTYDLIDYELFKDRSFKAFKKSDQYQAAVKKAISWDSSDPDSMIRNSIVRVSPSFLVD